MTRRYLVVSEHSLFFGRRTHITLPYNIVIAAFNQCVCDISVLDTRILMAFIIKLSAFALTHCYTLTHYSIIISVFAVELFLPRFSFIVGFHFHSKPGTSWFLRPPAYGPASVGTIGHRY